MRLAALASLLLFTGGSSISEVLKSPKEFDNKTLTIVGKVDKFEQRTSKSGKKYVTFHILQDKRWLNVYAHGELNPPLKDGQKVTVKGKFSAEKKVGTLTFRDEIELDLKDKSAIKRG